MQLPIHDFQSRYLPLPSPSRVRRKPSVMNTATASQVKRCQEGSTLAAAWSTWINSAGSSCPCPGYSLAFSTERYNDWEGDKISETRGALYPEANFPKDGIHHPETQDLIIVFKHGMAEPLDIKAHIRDTLSSNTDVYPHLDRAMATQHRTSLFVFLVSGSRMRVVRWDRSGAIFTSAFDYTSSPGRRTLRDLLWAFAHLSPEGRGHDLTAVRLDTSDPDFKLMTDLADCGSEAAQNDLPDDDDTVVECSVSNSPVFRFVRQLFARSLENNAPRFSLQVPTNGGHDWADFLVGSATFCAPGLTGRGTRGFVAWYKLGRRFVWLKDTWCNDREDGLSEEDILLKLNRDAVRNVPTFVCGGELGHSTCPPQSIVPLSTTPDGDFDPPARNTRANRKRREHRVPQPLLPMSNGPAISQPRPLKHHRQVVEEVCLELNAFNNGKQLVSVVRDAAQGHADAVRISKFLHSDISCGNILISPTVVCENGRCRVVWKGLLADWEIALSLTAEGSTGSRPPDQTGTWQFASLFILDYSGMPAHVSDDIEAFFNVLLYQAVCYLRGNCSAVDPIIKSYFDAVGGNESIGRKSGSTKRESMFRGNLPFGHTLFRLVWCSDDSSMTHPINDVFEEMLLWFRGRYVQLFVDSGGSLSLALDPMERRKSDVRMEQFVTHAAQLRDHSAFLAHLDDLLEHGSWPTKDKIDIQLEGAKAVGAPPPLITAEITHSSTPRSHDAVQIAAVHLKKPPLRPEKRKRARGNDDNDDDAPGERTKLSRSRPSGNASPSKRRRG